MKIFRNQSAELGRWFGAMFMPMLQKIIPVLNGIVMALTQVFKAIAGFAGYDPSQGITDAKASMIDLEDATDDEVGALADANAQAKKLRNNLLGIDELNISSPQEDTSTTTSTGNMAVDPALLKALQEYDSVLADVEMKATAIRDKILEWLGFTKSVNEETGEVNWTLEGVWNRFNLIKWTLEGIVAIFVAGKILGALKKIWSWLLIVNSTLGVLSLTAKTAISTLYANLLIFYGTAIQNFGLLGTVAMTFAGILLLIGGIFGTLSSIVGFFVDGSESKFDHLGGFVMSIGAIIAGIGLVAFNPWLMIIGGVIGLVGIFWDELVLVMSGIIATVGLVTAGILRIVAWLTEYIVDKLILPMTSKIEYIFQNWDLKAIILRMATGIFEGIGKLIQKFLDSKAVKSVLDLIGTLTGKDFSNIGGAFASMTESMVRLIDKETGSKSYDEILAENRAGWQQTTDAWQEGIDKMVKWNLGLVDTNNAEYKRKTEQGGFFNELKVFTDDIKNFGSNVEDLFNKKDSELSTKIVNDKIEKSNQDAEEAYRKQNEELEKANAYYEKQNEYYAKQNEELVKANEKNTENVDISTDINKVLEETQYEQGQQAQQQQTSLSTIQGQLSNLWWKLDSVQRACENIRINIIHNHYYSEGSSKHANGGFPAMRGTFVYNEGNNAELLGNINGRTAVVNNEQIISSVSTGVANAVAQVMSQNTNDTTSTLKTKIKGTDLLVMLDKVKAQKGKATTSNNLSTI